MNRVLVVVVATGAALLFGAAIALAQDAKGSATDSKAAGMSSVPMMAQMDEHLKKMQALHEKMMSAATPAERQKVMGEGRKEMHQGMMMMPMMQGGGMMDKKGGSDDIETRMQMMGKRLDMMQMMMQMMLDQQVVTAPSGPELAPKK